jgi:hypothetical protein
MRARMRRSFPSSIKPMVARFCVLVALGSSHAAAEEALASPLDEHEAVSRALKRTALMGAIEAQNDIQDGQRRVVSALELPRSGGQI